MEKTKSEVLGGLYTIRGGLSLISMATDEIDECEKKLGEQDNKIEKKKKDVEWEEKGIKNLETDKKRGTMSWSEKEYSKEKTKSRAKSDVENNGFLVFWRKRAVLSIAICVITMAIVVGLMQGDGILGIVDMFGNPLTLLLAVFLSAVLWGSIFGIVALFVYLFSYRKWKKDNVGDIKNKYKNIDSKIADRKKELQKLEGEVCSLRVQRHALVEKCANVKYQVSEKTKIIKQALNKEYGAWLHESDWENVDLLIYYIETNRADSVKEALQLVDNQRRAEKLEATIREVGTEIIGTIHSAFERMGEVLVGCFSLLSQQLSQMEENILSQGERMIKSTEMQTALIAKSGKTCAELLKDMKRNLSVKVIR